MKTKNHPPTNTINSSPETQPQPIEIQEEEVAYSGLRRELFQRVSDAASNSIEKTSQTDHVIRTAPSGAERTRGFYSAPEPNDVKPVGIFEKAASHIRQRQAAKKRRLEYERRRLHSSHGGVPEDTIDYSNPEKPKNPVFTLEREFSPTAPSVKKSVEKLEKNREDQGVPKASKLGVKPMNDYGEVYKKRRSWRERRIEKTQTRKDRRLKKAIDRLDRKLERGEDGKTLHGKYRDKKIHLLESLKQYSDKRVAHEDSKLVKVARQKNKQELAKFLATHPPLAMMSRAEAQQLSDLQRAGEARVLEAEMELWMRRSGAISENERRKLIRQRREASFRGDQHNRRLMKTAAGRQQLKRQFNIDNGVYGRLPEEDQSRK